MNWKVIAGLGTVGLAIWIVAPGAIAAALPLLVALICPISMVLMIGMMGRQFGQRSESPVQAADKSLNREEQLAGLRRDLQRNSEEQAALARQVEQLEGETAGATAANGRVIQQAEHIARAADGRPVQPHK